MMILKLFRASSELFVVTLPAMNKIERDQQTIRLMIRIYCQHHLKQSENTETYAALADYACNRLSHCRFGEYKPACKDCQIHCYRPDERALIQQVMRWAGPRMLFYSPRATFRHLWQCLHR